MLVSEDGTDNAKASGWRKKQHRDGAAVGGSFGLNT